MTKKQSRLISVNLADILETIDEYIEKGVLIYNLEGRNEYYKGGFESLMFLKDILIDIYSMEIKADE